MRQPLRVTGLSGRHRDVLLQLEDLFLSEGFRDVTVGELAERLKCSKRTLYEIASSKQELFLIVVEIWLHRIRDIGWEAAFNQADPEQRLADYLNPGVTESVRASPKFLEDMATYRPALNLLESHQKERGTVLRQIVEDGIRAGRFRPVHAALVAEIFLVSVNKLNEPDFLARAGVGFSEGFSELYTLLLHGLFKPEASTLDAKS